MGPRVGFTRAESPLCCELVLSEGIRTGLLNLQNSIISMDHPCLILVHYKKSLNIDLRKAA